MNASKRLRSVHVYIIGAVVALIFFVGLFFLLIRPVQAKNAELESTKSSKLQTLTGAASKAPKGAASGASKASAGNDDAAELARLQQICSDAKAAGDADVKKAQAEDAVARSRWRNFLVAQSPRK